MPVPIIHNVKAPPAVTSGAQNSSAAQAKKAIDHAYIFDFSSKFKTS